MRLLILLILLPFITQGQIVRTHPYYRPFAASCSYLLDQYSGAAAAYSLRKLRCAYSGSLIRVRRSSDNTEQDIGATANGDLDTAALKTFVGTGGTDDGFVVTWYDQSGNGNNVTQSTAGNQPLIMDNGVVLRQGGKPSIYFDGSNDYLIQSSFTINTYLSLYMVVNSPSFLVEHSANANNNDGFYFYGLTNQSWLFRRTNVNGASGGSAWSANQYIIADLQYNGSGAYYKNGVQQTNGTITGTSLSNTSATASLNIMARPSASLYMSGYLSELIIYDSDKTSDASSIRSNINAYYSIY